MICDVFVDASFCTFKLFNLGEAKNEEVCRNEENDQFERSKIVSIFYSFHNPDNSLRFLQESKVKNSHYFRLVEKKRTVSRPNRKRRKILQS